MSRVSIEIIKCDGDKQPYNLGRCVSRFVGYDNESFENVVYRAQKDGWLIGWYKRLIKFDHVYDFCPDCKVKASYIDKQLAGYVDR